MGRHDGEDGQSGKPDTNCKIPIILFQVIGGPSSNGSYLTIKNCQASQSPFSKTPSASKLPSSSSSSYGNTLSQDRTFATHKPN